MFTTVRLSYLQLHWARDAVRRRSRTQLLPWRRAGILALQRECDGLCVLLVASEVVVPSARGDKRTRSLFQQRGASTLLDGDWIVET